MKKRELVQIEAITEIICDRCMKCFTKDDADWYEMQSIEFTGGYASIFGDGMDVSIDLCPYCLKETLGQWLHIEHHEMLPKTGEASDKALSKYFGALKGKIKIADDFDGPLPNEIQASFEGLNDLPPPKGYQSWLHYAVETMEMRSHEIEGIFDDWTDHEGKAVSRDQMRAAAQRELFQVLKGSVIKYQDPTEPIDLVNTSEPIENLKGMLCKPDASVSIDDMRMVDGTENRGWGQEWNAGPPVGCEFGADSARFTRVLQRAISVFGNPLEAVQWLISFNSVVGGEPMKRVIGSEEGCKHVMDILSTIETGGVA